MTIAGLLASFSPSSGPRLLTPVISGDLFYQYDLSTIDADLGTSQTGARVLDTGFIRAQINGQGRGALGNGVSGLNSTNYQLIYDTAGTGNYSYTGNNDAFQPGTPYEGGYFEVDAARFIGGFNSSTSITGLTIANGATPVTWLRPDGVVVVLMGQGGGFGQVIYQYQAIGRTLRMCLSYYNDTGSNRTVRALRGGDPDFDAFVTDNIRANANQVSGRGTTTSKTLAIYAPPSGFTQNAAIITTWSGPNNITPVLSGGVANGATDSAIYSAWDVGTVAPLTWVHLRCYYAVGTSVANAFAALGL